MVLFDENILNDGNNLVMTSEEFGYFLLKMREKIGINQFEMAELVGYNKNSYNAFEKGKKLPRHWQKVETKVKDIVNEYLNETRYLNEDDFDKINTLFKEEAVLDMHYKGKNVVQIGMKLNFDEEDVFNFLMKKDLVPLLF